MTSSAWMLPRLTLGPRWRSSQACCDRRGASKMTVSSPTRVEDRLDELGVDGAGRVEQPDRPALAALGDHERGAGREVAEHLAHQS